MIVISGFNGTSQESVKQRRLASIELKQNKDSVKKKYTIKYNHQTMVMGKGFTLLDDGMTPKSEAFAEVNSINDFEKFAFEFTKNQHNNPRYTKKDGKYTIFSNIDTDHIYVDIIELTSISM